MTYPTCIGWHQGCPIIVRGLPYIDVKQKPPYIAAPAAYILGPGIHGCEVLCVRPDQVPKVLVVDKRYVRMDLRAADKTLRMEAARWAEWGRRVEHDPALVQGWEKHTHHILEEPGV